MDADRNLLFGVLALQAEFLDPDTFAEACSVWAARKETSLADLLVERGWLDPADKAAVERLLERKLAKHAGDVEATLAANSSEPVVKNALATVNVQSIQKTVHQPPTPDEESILSVSPAFDGDQRYTLRHLHAQGGIGQVWLAHDRLMNRDVAFKELRPDQVRNSSIMARFVEEAKVAGQLEHPSVVPIYELAHRGEDKRPFYTMRFIRGRTLSDAIRAYHKKRQAGQGTSLELRELLGAFIDVCNAIAYAHSRRVVHRDLKGQNIVLGDFGEVIVLDWGLAKLLDVPEEPSAFQAAVVERPAMGTLTMDSQNLTMAGQILGTPSYMPPEQAEGRIDLIDERSDVYSLGAILYEILVGEPPFLGDDPLQIVRKVIHDPVLPPRERVATVSAALNAICLKALAKQKGDRYASAKDVAQDVQRWLADEPVSAYPEPWQVKARRWVGHHRTLVTASAATLLVAAVSLAVAAVLLTAANAEATRQRDQAQLAKEQAEQNYKEAKAQKERADAQKNRADQNFQMALAAVKQYCTNIAQDQQLKDANFFALRKKLLATAIPFYENFVKQKAADDRLRDEQGLAYYQLARLHQDIGEAPQAIEDYQHMREIFGELEKAHPETPAYLAEIALTYHNTAIICYNRGDLAEAQQMYGRAVKMYEQVAKLVPDEPDYQDKLTLSEVNLGTSFNILGRHADAESHYRRGIAIAERLVADFPKSPLRPKYLRNLGWSRLNFGNLLRNLGHRTQAEEQFRKALDEFKQLVAQSPKDRDYGLNLAWCYINLGNEHRDFDRTADAEASYHQAETVLARLLRDFSAVPTYAADLALVDNSLGQLAQYRGDAKAAVRWYDKTIALLEPLFSSNPDLKDVRDRLANAHNGRAIALGRLGREEEARKEWERALAVPQEPSRHALFLAHLGRTVDAVAEASKVQAAKPGGEKPELSDDTLYELALVYAVLSAGRKDAELSRQDADHAMELLYQAVNKEYKDVGQMREDPNLDVLRSRADFKKLIGELEHEDAAAK